MEKFFDKISSYNLLNNVLPGAILCYLINIYWDTNILGSNIIESIFIYYFIGVIISRIGSVIVEPFCKKCKWVEFADYNKYIVASRNDSKLEILSETNNMFRTMLAMCLLLLVGKLYLYVCLKIQFVKIVEKEILLFALSILFACSYRKQTKYIKSRVDKDLQGGI